MLLPLSLPPTFSNLGDGPDGTRAGGGAYARQKAHMQETLAEMYREQCIQVSPSSASFPPFPGFSRWPCLCVPSLTRPRRLLRQLEDELCRLREEREAAKSFQNDKAKSYAQRSKMWKGRYEALERRRGLEAEVCRRRAPMDGVDGVLPPPLLI